jgi:hypothetical protein
VSQLSTGQIVVWAASFPAQFYLVYLIARKRIWQDFPVFSLYFTLNLIAGLLLAATYIRWGTQARQIWSVYWTLQGLVIFSRALVSVEVWRKALRTYPGIWSLAWRLLAAVGVLGLLLAIIKTYEQAPPPVNYVFSAERHLEFASAVTLLVFLLFCRYYNVSLEPAVKAITVGICFYSAVQGLNDTFVNQWLSHYVPLWRYMRVVSFQCTLVIWWLGLRVPMRAATQRPILYAPGVYEEFSLQVNGKLRDLNKRLEELLKP